MTQDLSHNTDFNHENADRYWHQVKGQRYGCSFENETLTEYKVRVNQTYGNLSGVKFGVRKDFYPHT
jgi:hypothetical protein